MITIDHIAIAIGSLGDALAFYRDVLGLDVEAPEEVASQRVRAQFLYPDDSGEGNGRAVALELIEPTADDSPVAKYLARRGPGIHHIAFRVPDIEAALAQMKTRGVRLIDETPRLGAHGSRVAFVHPSSTNGVLVELTQARA
jgi:methylmalonyl-CoA/ethylmalonyl-CoA epimerase